MAKTLEQVMEEQMMKMMAQMSNQNNVQVDNSQPVQSFDENKSDDNDDWEDWSSFNESKGDDSWEDWSSSEEGNDDWEDWNSSGEDSWGSEGQREDVSVNKSEDFNYSYQDLNSTSIGNNESQNIQKEENEKSGYLNAKNFAYQNYDFIGNNSIHSDLFFSSTTKEGFSEDFGQRYSDGSSNLEKDAIDFANFILCDIVKNGGSSSKKQQSLESFEEKIIKTTRKLEERFGKISSEKEFFGSQDMQFARAEQFDNVMNNEQPFESIVSEPRHATFMGNTFEYQQYQERKDFGVVFEEGNTQEDTCRNLREITRYISEDVANIVGGFDRITDLMILSDIIVVNGVAYSPILPLEFINHLPLDVQNSAKAGHFAWLFDFRYLRNMSSLTNLSFDSVDFVFKKVRVDLNLKRDFEPKQLFKICKMLTNLQINTYQFTRMNMDAYDDVFHRVKRSTEILDAVESWGWNTSKNRWTSVYDYYHNPEKRGLWKACGLITRTGVAATVSVGTVGLKAMRVGGKFTKKLVNGISTVVQAVKEDI